MALFYARNVAGPAKLEEAISVGIGGLARLAELLDGAAMWHGVKAAPISVRGNWENQVKWAETFL